MLWTRVVDPERPEADLELTLTLARDEAMRDVVSLDGRTALTVVARAESDHCVKVRVTGLEPDTEYFYRFRYARSDGAVSSRVGRTKTAPSEDSDRAVRFAVVCCQDFAGKYYHLHRLLALRDLDFVVHLGDYVYETTDVDTQDSTSRRVRFRSPEDALRLGSSRLAARSLDNYRDLYRTYRSDRDLQRLHERFPLIAIWDDHEFSNDAHGATATYEDGRRDETDLARRAAADQAWFEYMPLDDAEAPASPWDADGAFPDDFAIYRRFVFGRHVELVMTDLRRYRPDHVVPEDAFPGAVFATEDELADSGSLDTEPVPWVDIDAPEHEDRKAWLRAQADTLGFRAEAVHGRLSVPFVNRALTELADSDAPPPIDPEEPGLGRGYAYHQLLKSSEFSSAGARYLIAAEPFRALARKRYRETDGASERMMGSVQRAWFVQTLTESTRTFKLWGSSLCFMPRHLDLRHSSGIPEELRTRLLITADDWDGYPNERSALLESLADVRNLIVLSGDLHCFFAGTPFDPDAPERRVIEFVTGAVSSSTWLSEIRSVAASDPTLPPEVALAASAVGALLGDPVARPNPHLAYMDLERNGVSVLHADGEALDVEFLMLAPELVATPSVPLETLQASVSSEHFRVRAETGDLERDIDGRTWRWNAAEGRWVVRDA